MPPVSEAQRKWAWANKDKDTKEGKAAAEYAAADPGGKLPKKAKGQVDRSAHFKGNPGFPSSPEAASPPPAPHQTEIAVTTARDRPAAGGFSSKGHCVGHPSGSGHLRNSGHKGAHRIGKR